MKYEWDEAKNRSNFAKHGLKFEDAEQVFTGPSVTFVDSRFVYGEDRLITLGAGRSSGHPGPRAARRNNNAHHLHEEGEPA